MRFLRTRLSIPCLALSAFLCTEVARAAIIWDNGGPALTNQGASNMSDTLQTEDFQLSVTSNLTAITFWDLQAGAGDYNGSIFWRIVGNSGGQPNDSSVIGSGTATPTQAAQSTMLGFSVFQNDFAISVLGVGPGTYWLELHNGPLASNSFTDFYWAFADPNAANSTTNPGQEQYLVGSNPWSTNDNEHAFNISGNAAVTPTPEPGTLCLAAAAVAGIVLRRRRKA